jgi:hypothetical protein
MDAVLVVGEGVVMLTGQGGAGEGVYAQAVNPPVQKGAGGVPFLHHPVAVMEVDGGFAEGEFPHPAAFGVVGILGDDGVRRFVPCFQELVLHVERVEDFPVVGDVAVQVIRKVNHRGRGGHGESIYFVNRVRLINASGLIVILLFNDRSYPVLHDHGLPVPQEIQVQAGEC